MSRETCVNVLRAEGVSISDYDYTRANHRDKVFQELQWWHHAPVIPPQLPGVEQVLRTRINLPRFTREVPELIDQYVHAFEKVWAHRGELR